jgi:2-C-methyl-D-erythritol 4-phosphate cytidylyltransferase
VDLRPLTGILAAAGSGERLGGGRAKALVSCAGRPLMRWSLEALATVCDRVVVALPRSATELEDGDALAAVDASVDAVAGGGSRSESVRAAVEAAPEAAAYVVHDAARPLVTDELVERCVEALTDGWEGAVAAARMTDTVKQADRGGRVVRTLERAELWAVQTPQAFRAEALRQALSQGPAALSAATDDASLVEGLGGAVRVVEAPAENMKVTTPTDLRVAEALLARRDGAP